jgi:hypothetical protein
VGGLGDDGRWVPITEVGREANKKKKDEELDRPRSAPSTEPILRNGARAAEDDK